MQELFGRTASHQNREIEMENKRFLSNQIFRDGLGKIMCTLTLTCVHIENFLN